MFYYITQQQHDADNNDVFVTIVFIVASLLKYLSILVQMMKKCNNTVESQFMGLEVTFSHI
jgi:hypothetical protein